MSDAGLTRERVLAAAEEVLRRFGPDKATVVDVARALGVSHGSVYRHFPSKAALRDTVAERWLATISTPLAAIAEARGPAPARLRRWFDTLIGLKRTKVLDDPELFATYSALAGEARDVIRAHVDTLVGQLARIIADGVAAGELHADDPRGAARALFDATGRFHNPVHAGEWSDPGIDAAFEQVFGLLVRGLGAPGEAGGGASVAARKPARRRR